MKKIYYSLFVFACLSTSAQKQPIQLSWLNTAQLYYNGGSLGTNSVAECSDGSVVATGTLTGSVDFDPGPDTFLLSAGSSTSSYDVFLAKYSKKGELLFAIKLGDSTENSHASSNAVVVDAADNIYIAGSFNGTINFSSGATKITLTSLSTSNDNFLACYGKNGKLKFAENITHTNVDYKYCHASSLAVDKYKNIYVTGDFRGSKVDFDPGPDSTFKTSQFQDIFFSKYDSSGKLKFVKTIGGYDDDYSKKIGVDNNGNILLCGHFSSTTIDFDPNTGEQILNVKGKTDLFFAKYDSAGNYVFAKNIGKTKFDDANALAVCTDNSFVIIGAFFGNSVDFDPGNGGGHLLNAGSSQQNAFISKYDVAGNCIFAFSLGTETGIESGNDIGCDSAGNIFSIGKFSDKEVDFDPGPDSFFIKRTKDNYNYIAKYSSTGSLLFAEAIGNYNYYTNSGSVINCLSVIKGGQVIIAGSYNNSLDVDPGKDSAIIFSPSSSSFISKYDSKGNYLSCINPEVYAFYYNTGSTVTASAVDTKGNVYVCGTFNGRFDFDPGPEVYILESLADYRNSMFFAKYTPAGKLIFAKAIITESQFNDITIDKNENIYLTGTAFINTDFDPSDSIQTVDNGDTSNRLNSYGFFYAKYTADGNLIFVKGGGYNSKNYSYDIYFNAIAIDDNKNIYLSGSFSKNFDFDPSINNHVLNGNGGSIFYAKYDSLGNYIFANKLGSENSGGRVYDLKLNSKGDIIITGNFYGDSLDVDPGPGMRYLHQSKAQFSTSAFVSKYTGNGKFLSAFSIIGAGKDYNITEIKSLVADKNDNIYIAGKSFGKVDFDPGKDTAFLLSPGGMFFVSYTTNGTLRFLKEIALPTFSVGERNYINDICLDKNNNIYITGQFSSIDIDCDPGPDSVILVNKFYSSYYQYADLFIAKYDGVGNYIYSYDFDADSLPGYNESVKIMVDGSDNILYTGYGSAKLNFSTGNKKVYLEPTTERYNLFVAKYKPTDQQLFQNKVIGAVSATSNQQIKVYPNPIHDKVYFELNNLKENDASAIIQCINMQGKCLITSSVPISNHQLKKEISLPPNMQAGNYFLRVIINNTVYNSNLLLKQ